MMKWRCSRESDAARAASTGEWSQELHTHAADCSVCRDVALVAGALGGDQRDPSTDLPVASAGRIWWMAQLRARRTAADRALRPISVMELVAIAVMVPVAAGALSSAFPVVAAWLAELRVVSVVAEIGGYATLPGMTVAASAALAVLVLALARAVAGTDR